MNGGTTAMPQAATKKDNKTLTKQETLKKLASARVPKALKLMQLVGNLANYEPTESQAHTILKAMDAAYQRMHDRLTHPQRKEEEITFQL